MKNNTGPLLQCAVLITIGTLIELIFECMLKSPKKLGEL